MTTRTCDFCGRALRDGRPGDVLTVGTRDYDACPGCRQEIERLVRERVKQPAK